MKRFAPLLFSVICSLMLTLITVIPPIVPVDWARLNAAGQYIPQTVKYDWPHYGLQVALWLGILFGLWLWIKDFSFRPQLIVQNRHLYLLIGIVLLGFGLRLYGLERLPLIVDEIGFAAHASDILHGQQVPIFAPGHNANPAVYSWLVSGAMSLFGQTRFAMRLIPLLFGMLSIPAAYVLGQAWYGRRIGLMAAAFLATWPVHIFYSRMSLYNIVDPFFALLASAALGRAVRRGDMRQYVMAGILASVAQYFYHGSRLLIVLIFIHVLIDNLSRNPLKNISFRLFIYFLLPFVLVSLPRFAPMFFGGLPLTGNVEPMRLPADPGANMLRSVLAWVGQPDVSPFWLSDVPLLLIPALIMFLLGIGVCVCRWRNPRSLTLLMTIALVTIFGGAIWTASPLYVRYVTATPAVVLLIAIGNTQFLRGRAWVVRVLLIGLICGQGIWASVVQVDEAAGRITAAHWEADRLAQEAADLPKGAAVAIYPSGWSATETITFSHAVAAYGERRPVIAR